MAPSQPPTAFPLFARLPAEIRTQIWAEASRAPRVVPILPGVAHLSPATHPILATPPVLLACAESRAVARRFFRRGVFHPGLWTRVEEDGDYAVAGKPRDDGASSCGGGSSSSSHDDPPAAEAADMVMLHVRFPHQLIDPLLYMDRGMRWSGDDDDEGGAGQGSGVRRLVARRRRWWETRAERDEERRRRLDESRARLAREGARPLRRPRRAGGDEQEEGGMDATVGDEGADREQQQQQPPPSSADEVFHEPRPLPSLPPPPIRLAAYLDDASFQPVAHSPWGSLPHLAPSFDPAAAYAADLFARDGWASQCSPARRGVLAQSFARGARRAQEVAAASTPDAVAGRYRRPAYLPFADDFVSSVRFPPNFLRVFNDAPPPGGEGGANIAELVLLVLPPLTGRPDPVTHRIEVVEDCRVSDAARRALKEQEDFLDVEWRTRVREHELTWGLALPQDGHEGWRPPRVRLRFAVVEKWEDLERRRVQQEEEEEQERVRREAGKGKVKEPPSPGTTEDMWAREVAAAKERFRAKKWAEIRSKQKSGGVGGGGSGAQDEEEKDDDDDDGDRIRALLGASLDSFPYNEAEERRAASGARAREEPPATGTAASEPPCGLGAHMHWERVVHWCGTGAAATPYSYEAAGRPFWPRRPRCVRLPAEDGGGWRELTDAELDAEEIDPDDPESRLVDDWDEIWPQVRVKRFNRLKSWQENWGGWRVGEAEDAPAALPFPVFDGAPI